VEKFEPHLTGVSETMLWSLHNRASEAALPDARLIDPESLRIHAALRYDFAGHFGTPVGSLAVRAARIDAVLRRWLEQHPDGQVVSLGEGLETQVHRVDNGRMQWLSVDLPDAIRLRERFLTPDSRLRHLDASALDPAWMNLVDPGEPVFVIAQGLLMYLPPARVRGLFQAIAERFPGAHVVFDTIPRWFSHLTRIGVQQTPQYRLPPMPWGISTDELAPTLHGWHAGLGAPSLLDYRAPRGLARVVGEVLGQTPFLRHELPSLVHLTVADRRPIRRSIMTSSAETGPRTETVHGVLAAATRSAGNSNALAIGAAQVIARRVALGVAASVNPLQADHGEFARMVPEKLAACTEAGRILLRWSDTARRQAVHSACDEVMVTARASTAMAHSANPAALASAYARAWCARMAAHSLSAGVLLLEAQDAAMAPFRETVAVNLQRLAS
jgi:hypothetical protein